MQSRKTRTVWGRYATELFKINKPSELVKKCDENKHYNRLCLDNEFWEEYLVRRFGFYAQSEPANTDMRLIAFRLEHILNFLFPRELYPTYRAMDAMIDATDDEISKIVGKSCCTILGTAYMCIKDRVSCKCVECEKRLQAFKLFLPKGPLNLKLGVPYNNLTKRQKDVITRIINLTHDEAKEAYITPAGPVESFFSLTNAQELLKLLPEFGYTDEDRAYIVNIINEDEVFPLYDILEEASKDTIW